MVKQFQLIVLLILCTAISGCNKSRNYEIMIVNDTDYEINELEIQGTSNNYFKIPKRSTTNNVIISYKGSRSGVSGENCFRYTVNSFTDSIRTYTDSANCSGCIVVRDLSESQINTLTLSLDSADPSCGPYKFIIGY